MHHFGTEMCTRAHFCSTMVHCGIWDWFIVGFVQQVYLYYQYNWRRVYIDKCIACAEKPEFSWCQVCRHCWFRITWSYVVITTTSCATSDDKVGIMATPGFHCWVSCPFISWNALSILIHSLQNMPFSRGDSFEVHKSWMKKGIFSEECMRRSFKNDNDN